VSVDSDVSSLVSPVIVAHASDGAAFPLVPLGNAAGYDGNDVVGEEPWLPLDLGTGEADAWAPGPHRINGCLKFMAA